MDPVIFENNVIVVEDSEEEQGASNLVRAQKENERREIRKQYMEIQSALVNEDRDMRDLSQTLDLCEGVYSKVTQPRESALDSTVVARITELSYEKICEFEREASAFDSAYFCKSAALVATGLGSAQISNVSEAGEEQEAEGTAEADAPEMTLTHWARLGEAMQPFFRMIPQVNFMYGALDKQQPVAKARKKKVTATKKQETPAESPEEVRLQNLEDSPVQREVDRLLLILNDYCTHKPAPGLDFFEFITHPHSFGHTIENLFHASFLVHDGRIRVREDDNRLPIIMPVSKEEQEAMDPADTADTSAFIVALDEPTWREIVEVFQVTEPVIPHLKVEAPCETALEEDEGPSTSSAP